MTRSLLILVLFAALSVASAVAASFDHSHTAFSKILKSRVAGDLVDYTGLKRSPARLDAYLKTLSGVSERDFKQWNQDQQIAYYVNLYNAQTLKLIIDNYPIASIKKIGWLPGAAWRKKFVPLMKKTVSLGHIEHEILRKEYNVPEIHFALVCAAKGCPPLLNEAYNAERLSEQLAAQGRKFLADSAKNRVDAAKRQVHLSPIFKWFDEDFENKSGSVIGFVQDYLPAAGAKQLSPGFRIEYTEYDWSLNDQAK